MSRLLRPRVIAYLTCSFVTIASSASAQFLKHMAIDVSAGGGFVGLDQTQVLTQPHLNCDNKQPPTCTPDSTNVVVSANASYAWQPAVATGLIFRYVFSPRADPNDATKVDGIGVGLGGQFVFVPHGSSTRAAPAITLHVGTHSQQLFFGWVFAPTDSVDIPGGGATAVLPATFQTNTLLRSDAGHAAQFFAGIVIGGVAVTQPKQ